MRAVNPRAQARRDARNESERPFVPMDKRPALDLDGPDRLAYYEAKRREEERLRAARGYLLG